jgi:proteasome assembly chaperone 3
MSIPALSANVQGMDIGGGVESCPFPAPAKQASGLVNGVQTEVSSVYFADKILITISQAGRLSQWVYASQFPY